MSRPGEPFEASDFTEPCEDCHVPAGSLCRPDCPTGYSSLTQQAHRASIEKRQANGDTPGRLPRSEH